MKKCKHFHIWELVSEKVYKKYGETAWSFFDPRLLGFIDWLRDGLKRPITINNWDWGGEFEERGLRSNLDSIPYSYTEDGVLYMSAHCTGQAVDFDVKGMGAEEVRKWLRLNKYRTPYNIRIEKNVNWVHLDVRGMGIKIYEF